VQAEGVAGVENRTRARQLHLRGDLEGGFREPRRVEDAGALHLHAVGVERHLLEHDFAVAHRERGGEVRPHRLVLLDEEGAVGEPHRAAVLVALGHLDLEVRRVDAHEDPKSRTSSRPATPADTAGWS